MALDKDFERCTTDTVKVEAVTGINDYGALSYSAAPSTHKAYIQAGNRLVVGPDGREVVSRATIFVLSTSAAIGVQDRITLSGSTDTPRILNVDVLRDVDGQHHLEVSVA